MKNDPKSSKPKYLCLARNTQPPHHIHIRTEVFAHCDHNKVQKNESYMGLRQTINPKKRHSCLLYKAQAALWDCGCPVSNQSKFCTLSAVPQLPELPAEFQGTSIRCCQGRIFLRLVSAPLEWTGTSQNSAQQMCMRECPPWASQDELGLRKWLIKTINSAH